MAGLTPTQAAAAQRRAAIQAHRASREAEAERLNQQAAAYQLSLESVLRSALSTNRRLSAQVLAARIVIPPWHPGPFGQAVAAPKKRLLQTDASYQHAVILHARQEAHRLLQLNDRYAGYQHYVAGLNTKQQQLMQLANALSERRATAEQLESFVTAVGGIHSDGVSVCARCILCREAQIHRRRPQHVGQLRLSGYPRPLF